MRGIESTARPKATGAERRLGIRISRPVGRIASVLELDVPNGWTKLGELESTLLLLRIQVLASRTRRARDRVIHRLRVAELDGAPIPDWRRPRLVSELGRALGAGQRAKYLDWAQLGVPGSGPSERNER